jgi:hypothetical protein
MPRAGRPASGRGQTCYDPNVTADPSPASEPKGRIIPFRPRRPAPQPEAPPPSGPVEDLSQYERSGEEDDYRHRMLMNGAALLVVLVLAVVGIWIANTMAEMRKNQDCVLSGRRGCTPVTVAPAPRE